MTELFSHIAYLLRHHDCVVLPGVGAFVAVSHGAHLDRESNRFTPPRREITFNSAITSDDGLIAWSIARRRAISYEQASAIGSRLIAEATRRLQVEGELDMGRTGTLTRHRDGRLSFTASSAAAPRAAMPELQLKPFVAAPVISLEIEHRSQQRSVAVVRMPFHRRAVAAVASLALLLTLGFTLSTPIDVATAHTASLSGPSFTPPRVETIAPLPEPAGMQLAIAMPSATNAVLAVQPRPVPAAPERFVMVVASLPSRLMAEKFVTEKADSRLQILEKDGKFRVYITAGTTQAELTEKVAAMPDCSSKYPDAWVCRK